MAELNSEVTASPLQEFPDIAILAGHLRLKHQLLGRVITQPLFLEVCQRNPKAWSCFR